MDHRDSSSSSSTSPFCSCPLTMKRLLRLLSGIIMLPFRRSSSWQHSRRQTFVQSSSRLQPLSTEQVSRHSFSSDVKHERLSSSFRSQHLYRQILWHGLNGLLPHPSAMKHAFLHVRSSDFLHSLFLFSRVGGMTVGAGVGDFGGGGGGGGGGESLTRKEIDMPISSPPPCKETERSWVEVRITFFA